MVTAVITENTTVQNTTGQDAQYTGVEDGSIVSTQPTTREPDSGFLLVALDGSGERRFITQFSGLSNIPSTATVTSAIYYVNRVFTNTGTISVEARQLLQPWADGEQSWEQYSIGNDWDVDGADSNGVDRVASAIDTTTWTNGGGYEEIDLTSYVQDVIDGSITDYGVLVETTTSSGDSGIYTASNGTDNSRPELIVIYTTGAPAQTISIGLLSDTESQLSLVPVNAGSPPTITDINTDETIVDAEQDVTFQTTGFSGEITSAVIFSGSNETDATGINSTSGSGDFDVPDVAGYTSDTAGSPFTSASHSVSVRLSSE